MKSIKNTNKILQSSKKMVLNTITWYLSLEEAFVTSTLQLIWRPFIIRFAYSSQDLQNTIATPSYNILNIMTQSEKQTIPEYTHMNLWKTHNSVITRQMVDIYVECKLLKMSFISEVLMRAGITKCRFCLLTITRFDTMILLRYDGEKLIIPNVWK